VRGCRQETFEDEAIGGEPGNGQGRHRRTGPRHRTHGDAGILCRPHEAVAGIAHERRARIRDQRGAFPRGEARDERGHALRLVVLVQRDQACGNAAGLE
jgi:hypothetical protein